MKRLFAQPLQRLLRVVACHISSEKSFESAVHFVLFVLSADDDHLPCPAWLPRRILIEPSGDRIAELQHQLRFARPAGGDQ
jgi:hypothetical protein